MCAPLSDDGIYVLFHKDPLEVLRTWVTITGAHNDAVHVFTGFNVSLSLSLCLSVFLSLAFVLSLLPVPLFFRHLTRL